MLFSDMLLKMLFLIVFQRCWHSVCNFTINRIDTLLECYADLILSTEVRIPYRSKCTFRFFISFHCASSMNNIIQY
uniref:Secreted protein n=1 Tax=Anguilla anguilla TaxID=7936 RepID=A0A0E9XMY4_ANGAN